MAPSGTKVVAHIHPSKRGSWDLNGEVDWYVDLALKYYQCIECYFPKSRDVRNCDIVEFIPHSIPFPKVKLKDFLVQSAEDIITLLTHPPSNTTLSLEARDPVRNALLELVTQLKRIDQLPDSVDHSTISDALSPRMQSNKTIITTSLQNSGPHIIPCDPDDAPSPRVNTHSTHKDIIVNNLLNQSNLSKNIRYRNTSTHSYKL